MSIDRRKLKLVAKKTLGLGQDDVKEISSIYLTHLRHLVTKYPDDTNFNINLDDGVGAVHCCVCDTMVPPGKGSPEENGVDIFGSLANYEEHLRSQSHILRRRQSLQAPNSGERQSPSSPIRSPASKTSVVERPPPPKYTAQQFAAEPHVSLDGSNRRQGPIDLTRTTTSQRPRSFSTERKGSERMGLRNASVPDNGAGPSRVTTPTPRSSFDADYQLALQLHRELNGADDASTPAVHTEVRGPSNSTQQSSPGMQNTISPSHIPYDNNVIDVDELYGDELSFDEVYQAQLSTLVVVNPDEKLEYYSLVQEGPDTIKLKCNLCSYSTVLPGSGRVEAQFDYITARMAEFEAHLKSAYHCRKRVEASRFQTAIDHNPNLLNTQAYRDSTSLSALSSPYSSPAPPNLLEESNTGKRKLPGEWEDTDDLNPFSSGFTSASAFYQGSLNNEAGYPQPPMGVEHHQQTMQQPPSMWNQVGTGISNAVQHGVEQLRVMTKSLNESHIANLSAYGSRGGSNGRDFGLNYDDSGPVSKFDVGTSDPESRFRDFMNKALEDFKDVMSVTDAQVKLQLASQDDCLNGMSVRLLPHQIIGVSWMVDQEKDLDKSGGILADAMGLGKTVQMIATMAVNQPPPRTNSEFAFFKRPYTASNNVKGKGPEPDRRTTLVLAPASLLQQWSEEFTDKAKPGTFRVHVHHGKDKLKFVEEIEKYDVIITSYQTLTMDIPKIKKRNDGGNGKKKDKEESDLELLSSDSDTMTSQRRSVGPLAKVKWYRIVIDEAQNIRNRSTRISKCVAKLDSRYRWCLTGTPVTNSLADVYGYMRFCRFEPWNDWKFFNDRIAKVQKKRPAIAGERAQTALKPHLMRRTKESKIDNRPIIQLGPKEISLVELDFSAEEREMYTRVESDQKQIVSKFYKEGTVMKNYAFILVMILRLRQLCCHPSLATTKSDDEKEEEEDDAEVLIDKARKALGEPKFKEIIERFRARVETRMRAEVSGAEADDDECAICLEPFTNNRKVTGCGHEFCSDCLNEVIRANEGREADEDGAQCPLCRAPIDQKRIFSGTMFEPSQEEIDKITRSLPAPADGQSRPFKRAKLEETMNNLTLVGTPELGQDKLEPSTKMRHMAETLVQWCKDAPEDKVIVYSQWTSMLDLVDNYLKESGFNSLRYDGKMNRMARVEAVAKFKRPNGPPIMLISLKCGGVGLNLTCANRVVNLDLAWNYATEAQAYDRVHRLGQHKPVSIQRLVIKNTIEERIIRLQAKKQGLSDAALGEGTAGKIKRMTAREIAQLFDLRV